VSTAEGLVVAVNVSDGGVPKRPVGRAMVRPTGVAGDRQDDTRHHGGPDRAVCLYSLELIDALSREGHPIAPGFAGENLTVSGLDWSLVVPGIRLVIVNILLEVTSYTMPCKTIRGSFLDGRFTRISQLVNPGWSRVYARVLASGEVGVGDTITVIPQV
jgi:MOSC domain-containing protein YiiM